MVRNSSPEIHHCSITGNEYGVLLTSEATPRIHHSNLFNNGVTDVWIREYQGDTPIKVDLSDNWWSVDDIVLVEERVLDGIDDPAVNAYAVLEPFLPEAVSTDPKRP
jgi:nitrous oxidase accessory protein NosD